VIPGDRQTDVVHIRAVAVGATRAGAIAVGANPHLYQGVAGIVVAVRQTAPNVGVATKPFVIGTIAARGAGQRIPAGNQTRGIKVDVGVVLAALPVPVVVIVVTI
jgi:hypothetical protein